MHRMVGLILLVLLIDTVVAQPITGIWHGKRGSVSVELKMVKTGDSLTGTVYYFQSKKQYQRYSIKGYFDGRNNDVIWWDDQLLEQQGSRQWSPAVVQADFNCPGEDQMFLNGQSSAKQDRSDPLGELALRKSGATLFQDEWNDLIADYFVGANDPQYIDSIGSIALRKLAIPTWKEEKQEAPEKPLQAPTAPALTVSVPPSPVAPAVDPAPAKTNPTKPDLSTMFNTRVKDMQTLIPFRAGEEIVLSFYDNAEIDGDSIALFLNGKLLKAHIRLTDQPAIIRLTADQLSADNELVMVAENLGSIPPNTSYMVVQVGSKKFEARLFANEKSSALIRLVRPL
jgi:hypothetical protein